MDNSLDLLVDSLLVTWYTRGEMEGARRGPGTAATTQARPDPRPTLGGCEVPTLTVMYEDDEGWECKVEVPATAETCGNCQGRGRHAHAIDGNGLTADDLADWSDEEIDDYRTGRYDVSCSECRGTGRVLEPVNEDALGLTPEQRVAIRAYHDGLQVESECYLERMSELRFGC